ncbi:response regulator transcription factor [Nocardioides sp. zg-1230]|uniref:response regulator transcription factor n=1 Tax=Nocardioides sp. zg-1230 TaxID=2736601 RepID=UPI001553144E|nr:response regulator transcription factor [Nocardioides sp. zg-1230]NPC44268.1 response regulator transcription factor [Nocardioides sp. zg-1230]
MADVRVVVVDDQEPFRRAAGAVVDASQGFELVGYASDGEQSLTSVLRHRPDLVLMDVNLPGIDGLEATRRIKQLEPSPVVVLLSTYELTELGADPLECGAHAYLAKADFDSARLRQVWRESAG